MLSRVNTRLRAWARTPAGMWILFALALFAISLIIALLMTFS